MKKAVVQNKRIVIQEVPDLTLDDKKGAVVEVLDCGLCGSDIIKLQQGLVPDGTVLGHEIVGRVVEINSNTSFKSGDVILSSHHVPCGECVYCKGGNEPMCRHFKKTNFEPGGFSERVFLSEEHLEKAACKKPENLSDEEAVFYEPLACCVRAIRRAGLKPKEKALVIGLGSIGIIMAQALKAFGIEVAGCDLRQDRVELAEKLGIKPSPEFLLDCRVANAPRNDVKSLPSCPPALLPSCDAVFMTSGADAALDTALKSVRDGGQIVVFSSTPLNTGYANNEIYYRELTVMGSYSPAAEDLKTSLELLASGKINVKGLSEIYDFADINQAFDDALSNKILKAYVKIKGQE